MRYRITESRLRRVISEDVSDVISEGMSDESGISRDWLRRNGGFSDTVDAHDDMYPGLKDIRRRVEGMMMSDRRLGSYFGEPSNGEEDLKDELSGRMWDSAMGLIDVDDYDGLASFNILTDDVYFNRWVNEVFWRLMGKYRGVFRPSLSDSMKDVRRSLEDIDAAKYGLGDASRAKAGMDRLYRHMKLSDPYGERQVKSRSRDEGIPFPDAVKGHYNAMVGR